MEWFALILILAGVLLLWPMLRASLHRKHFPRPPDHPKVPGQER